MNRKQVLSILLDVLVLVCTVICLYYLYISMRSGTNRRVLTVAVLIPILFIIVCELICWTRPTKIKKKRDPLISTLVLLGEDNRPIKVWDLTGKVGLLIGKSSEDYQVDIDLSDTDYHTYVDPEHALINYQESGWWLHDVSTRNGISIIRGGKELLPGHHAPAKLEPGDIIRIAEFTRIAVN